MFRAEPLMRVQLLMLTSEAQDAALELARFGAFNPVADAPAGLVDAPAERYREAWLEANSRLDKLLDQCGAFTLHDLPAASAAPTLADLQALNDWLKDVWLACLGCHDETARIEEERKHLAALDETLARLERLDVDLAQLLRADSLLAVLIGSLPAAGLKRVSEALSMTGHVVSRFDQAGDQAFVVIAGPRHRQEEVRGVLAQAGWRDLAIPEALRAHPRTARAWLDEARRRLETTAGSQCRVAGELRERFGPRLQDARLSLALARPLAEAALSGVRGRGGLAALVGWVPRRRVDELRAMLNARFGGRYWLDLRDATAAEARTVPSLVHYPAWLRPFVPLVRSYGVPRYGEFDPTLPFAFTYLLLFGAMFGDVGHGAVILLLAASLYPRLGRVAWIGVAAGAVSMLFGLVYGSVFGYEDLIEPLWQSPLHDPLRLLTLAVAFGFGFIGLTLLLNTYNRLSAGRVAEALFDSAGLAGLVFYLGAVGSVASLAGAVDWGTPSAALAALGLVVVAAFKWAEARGGWGERALITVIETLETATNLFANTLSFMRVAAFSLNHVALALAVFTLAAGLGAASYWLTLLVGNLIIIVLEGGIVAIQALRLMYYEGFSRFFSGDGVEFVPLQWGKGVSR